MNTLTKVLIRRRLLVQVRAVALMVGALGFAAGAGAQVPGGDGGDAVAGAMRNGIPGGQMVRGTITAVAADQVTLKTEAGEVYQIALSSNTRLTKARQPVKLADVKVGDGVGAMGVLDAPTKTVHAVFVAVIDAEDVKKAREGMGKIYIVGKVTAMDDVKVTVLRTDGVSQVIEVDEGTSFKRGGRDMALLMNSGMGGMGMGEGRPGRGAGGDAAGGARPANAGAAPGAGAAGESITLADVKIGDTVAGKGAVKHGVFVPTELGVMAPGQRRRRPNGEGGPPAGNAAATAAPVQ